ncbi:MAG: tRNA lysidine(34) synthetase TilS [Paraglaciecola sp.]|nr:tRNA lysidine(34) synthetase TilS [Paraglaciecola sp.]
MQLIHTLQQQLSALALRPEQGLVLAYSGGVDSHVLLHLMCALRDAGDINNPLSAIHIHHGLSQHADDWLRHCQQVCLDLALPFSAAKVTLAQGTGESLEALARTARYTKLYELAPVNSVILLAQHQDDQLETFLLQLKRGAGPKGLAAMASYSSKTLPGTDKVVHLARPLLSVSQHQIVAYATQHKLDWVEDESNQNTNFERNFLRHQILPSLVHKWPEIAKTVSRSAALCAEQQSLLEEVSKQKLQEIRRSNTTLSLAALKQVSEGWLVQIVRQWLHELEIQSPSQAILQKIKHEVIDAKADANPILQWGNWQLRRFADELHLVPLTSDILPHTLVWQEQNHLSLPSPLGALVSTRHAYAQSSDCHLLIAPDLGEIKLQFGGYSQRFTPQGSQHSKPLKQWYKEWQIPPWQRDKIALVKQNDVPQALLIEGKWRLSHKALTESLTHSVIALHYKSHS